MLTYVAVHACLFHGLICYGLLSLSVRLFQSLSLMISPHCPPTNSIIRLPLYRAIVPVLLQGKVFFISIRFTPLEAAWELVKWKTLIYAFGRQGTELKDKFLFCNITNLRCRCCFDGELSSLSINEVLGVPNEKALLKPAWRWTHSILFVVLFYCIMFSKEWLGRLNVTMKVNDILSWMCLKME